MNEDDSLRAGVERDRDNVGNRLCGESLCESLLYSMNTRHYIERINRLYIHPESRRLACDLPQCMRSSLPHASRTFPPRATRTSSERERQLGLDETGVGVTGRHGSEYAARG